MHQSAGIVLHSIKYRDYDQIVTLFTREEGLIQLLVKRAYTKAQGFGNQTALFVEAHHIYTKGRGDLYISKEISPLSFHLELRQSTACLEAAVQLAKTILHSQMPAKACPSLYELFLFYLKAVAKFPLATRLVASFRLKLLRYEGLFGVTPQCALCQESLHAHYLYQGESFCEQHAPPGAIFLSLEEAAAFYTLAFSRSLVELESLAYAIELEEKIAFFCQTIN